MFHLLLQSSNFIKLYAILYFSECIRLKKKRKIVNIISYQKVPILLFFCVPTRSNFKIKIYA